jgi:hypothetical protein
MRPGCKFRDVMPCIAAHRFPQFRGTWWLHLEPSLFPGGCRPVGNLCNDISVCTASRPRRLCSTLSPLWEPQILHRRKEISLLLWLSFSTLWRPKFVEIIYTNSVRTSRETHYVSATKPNRLKETVTVYCENHTEHTNTLCGQNAQFCNIYKSSSYLTGNTLRLRYKAQPVNAVQGNSRCLLWEPYGTHKYTVWAECRVYYLVTGGTYTYHWALEFGMCKYAWGTITPHLRAPVRML